MFWLISKLCYQAIEPVYLIKWPVSVYIYIYWHGAHTREEQEHADEDINSNDNI